jgi:HEAT repeat protein
MWLGCHADDNDPAGQAQELDDPVRREHALARLATIQAQRLVAAKGDRSAAPLREFNEVTHAQLVKTYLEHPEDNQSGIKIMQLMSEMREPRTLPALLKALDWRTEVTEDHAVSAANTLAVLPVAADKRGEVVTAIAAALKRVQGARGVDNRMRKGFIEVLGKLGDKRAIPTLVEVALRQDPSQNFLFNKLAVQQLIGMPDESSVEPLVKALYMFDVNQPLMRMEEDAEAALIAIGRPALAPLMKAARGENPEVNRLVELSIEAFRRKDPEQAAKLNKQTLIAREAVLTLGRLGQREALPLMLSETNADDPERRITGALALVGIAGTAGDPKAIVAAIDKVYDKAEKQARPQLLVAMRHLYNDEVMPKLLAVAKTTETELPPVQMYGWVSYALLANRSEAKQLGPILDREELIAGQLKDYRVTIKAAEQCDTAVPCWQDKLKDKDKVIVRKAANMLARYGRGNAAAVAALVPLLGHADLEVRNEALSALDAVALRGSPEAVKKIDELRTAEAGRSIWTNFSREALPTRSRLQLRAGS